MFTKIASAKEVTDIALDLMLGNVKMNFQTMRELMCLYDLFESEVERLVNVIEEFNKVIDQTEGLLLLEIERKDEDAASGAAKDILASTVARYQQYIETNQTEIVSLLARQSLLKLGIENYITHAESLMAEPEEVEEAEEDAESDYMDSYIDSLFTDSVDDAEEELEIEDSEEEVEEPLEETEVEEKE
jgi:hypothetical protein